MKCHGDKILLRSNDTPTGIGIMQVAGKLQAFSPRCYGVLWHSSHDKTWRCTTCDESVAPTGAFGDWIWIQEEDSVAIKLFVAQWTGIPVQALDVKVEGR